MASGELSELMRTMGQDLDAMGFASNRIAADPDSFTVSGIADRHYHVLRFWKYELRDTSAERRANRRAPGAPPPPNPPAATEKAAPRWQFWRR